MSERIVSIEELQKRVQVLESALQRMVSAIDVIMPGNSQFVMGMNAAIEQNVVALEAVLSVVGLTTENSVEEAICSIG